MALERRLSIEYSEDGLNGGTGDSETLPTTTEGSGLGTTFATPATCPSDSGSPIVASPTHAPQHASLWDRELHVQIPPLTPVTPASMIAFPALKFPPTPQSPVANTFQIIDDLMKTDL